MSLDAYLLDNVMIGISNMQRSNKPKIKEE
jgi:hypothetical protein